MKKLNNKKGFTLVELIVVIAIVGILAAILIPTMLGYVARSRVTNANSTASKLREHVSYFMTQANADEYGMFVSEDAVCDVIIVVDDFEWDVTTTNKEAFIARGAIKWQGHGSGRCDDENVNINAETKLAIYLASLFKDIQKAHIEFKLVGGVCMALYFTEDTINPVTELPGFGDGQPWDTLVYGWDGANQGITSSGYIVGTSPVLDIL